MQHLRRAMLKLCVRQALRIESEPTIKSSKEFVKKSWGCFYLSTKTTAGAMSSPMVGLDLTFPQKTAQPSIGKKQYWLVATVVFQLVMPKHIDQCLLYKPPDQVRRLSDEQGARQAEASVTTRRLEKTEADLAVLRAELSSERSARERTNVTVGLLRRKVVEEKAGCEEMKLQLALVRAARRRSESQASAAVDSSHVVRASLFWVCNFFLTSLAPQKSNCQLV